MRTLKWQFQSLLSVIHMQNASFVMSEVWFQKHFLNLYNALLPLFQKELSWSLLAWNTGGFPLRLFKPVSLF